MTTTTFKPPNTRFMRRRTANKSITKALEELRKASPLGLHLGAGGTKIESLVNCDLFDPAADRVVDATNLVDFSDNSVDMIEHHHMLEHLSFTDFEKAMSEWHRVLRPKGYLVMTCPDIFRVSQRYVYLRVLSLVRDVEDDIDYTIKMIVGSQEHEGMFHKNHFDKKRMYQLLPKFGLKIEFMHRYPSRATPSLLVVASKK